MIEKGIRGGIYHEIYKYLEANNKYMNNYDKNKESSYLMYLHAKNLYGWATSQKMPVNDFKWKTDISMFDEKFIRNYDEDSNKGYILEVDIVYPKDLHDLLSNLPFLPEIMKINKCNKLVCNLYDKYNYVAHIRILKQALDHGLVFKKYTEKLYLIKKTWLKPYIDMNNKVSKEAKNDFENFEINE